MKPIADYDLELRTTVRVILGILVGVFCGIMICGVAWLIGTVFETLGFFWGLVMIFAIAGGFLGWTLKS